MATVWHSIMFCPTTINFGRLGFVFNEMELCLLRSLFSCHASILYMNELIYIYFLIFKKLNKYFLGLQDFDYLTFEAWKLF
jgi:hypothetical protein